MQQSDPVLAGNFRGKRVVTPKDHMHNDSGDSRPFKKVSEVLSRHFWGLSPSRTFPACRYHPICTSIDCRSSFFGRAYRQIKENWTNIIYKSKGGGERKIHYLPRNLHFFCSPQFVTGDLHAETSRVICLRRGSHKKYAAVSAKRRLRFTRPAYL